MTNPQLIVLGVVAGAGFSVLMGYAATRFFFVNNNKSPHPEAGGEFDQVRYMREVRLRTHDGIAASLGYGRGALDRARREAYSEDS